MFKKTLPSRNSLHWFSVLEEKKKKLRVFMLLWYSTSGQTNTGKHHSLIWWGYESKASQLHRMHMVYWLSPPAPFTVNGCHIWLQGVYKPDKKRDFLLSPGHSWGNNSRLRQQMADQTRWNRCAGSNCPGQLTLCPNPRC